MRIPLPRRLVQRLAWVTFLAIATSAACVALVNGVLTDRFAYERETHQLTNAASVLAQELVEPGVDPVFIAWDEARELKSTDIRLAVYEGAQLFAGDARIPAPRGEGCFVSEPFIACAVYDGRFLAVAARDTATLRSERRSLVLSSLVAVAITSLLGALLAQLIAQRLFAPLSRLNHALERVPANAPESAEIGADEGVEEVDSLRATLRATFARLGHALATSRRFAADAAHELRSPLTVIMGQLELSIGQSQEEARESTERARKTAARLSTLVDRLLVLATPSAPLLVSEVLELQGAVDDAIDLIGMEVLPRINVTSDAEAPLQGDRVLLAHMIANMIENALKFSESSVEVHIAVSEKDVAVHVSDHGPGIPEADRERVFEPFFRTRASRASKVRGHGIGLALIAHVANIHGGTAHFAACERGACLVITLPRFVG